MNEKMVAERGKLIGSMLSDYGMNKLLNVCVPYILLLVDTYLHTEAACSFFIVERIGSYKSHAWIQILNLYLCIMDQA